MRISDWSSDVCSSDLHESLVRRLKVIRPLPSRLDIKKAIISTKRLQSEYSVRGGSFGYRMRYYVTIDRINLIGVLYYDLAKTLRGRLHAIRQIGRASCRERVWQYV